jgi:conjugative transfer signal peptidase TraF
VVRAEPPAILFRVGKVKAVPVVAMSALGIVLVATPRAGITPWLVWNASASVPVGLYIIAPRAPRRSDFVLVRLPPGMAKLAQRRGYLTATDFILKPVAAVAGDQVCRIGHQVLVRGEPRAIALRRDTKQRPMPVWHDCRHLVGGDVFLLADDAQSFDSRYFGPIAADLVGGRAIPLRLPARR